MNGTINPQMPTMQLPGQQSTDIGSIVEALKKQSEQEKLDQLTASKEAASKQLQSAGIQAGAQLLGGLMSQSAAAQRQKQQAELEAQKTTAEVQSKGLQEASRAQQDAFTKLMGSMRSALVGG